MGREHEGECRDEERRAEESGDAQPLAEEQHAEERRGQGLRERDDARDGRGYQAEPERVDRVCARRRGATEVEERGPAGRGLPGWRVGPGQRRGGGWGARCDGEGGG